MGKGRKNKGKKKEAANGTVAATNPSNVEDPKTTSQASAPAVEEVSEDEDVSQLTEILLSLRQEIVDAIPSKAARAKLMISVRRCFNAADDLEKCLDKFVTAATKCELMDEKYHQLMTFTQGEIQTCQRKNVEDAEKIQRLEARISELEQNRDDGTSSGLLNATDLSVVKPVTMVGESPTSNLPELVFASESETSLLSYQSKVYLQTVSELADAKLSLEYANLSLEEEREYTGDLEIENEALKKRIDPSYIPQVEQSRDEFQVQLEIADNQVNTLTKELNDERSARFRLEERVCRLEADSADLEMSKATIMELKEERRFLRADSKRLNADLDKTKIDLAKVTNSRDRLYTGRLELEEISKLSKTALQTLSLIRTRLALNTQGINDSQVYAGNDVAHMGKLQLDVILCFLGILDNANRERLEQMYGLNFEEFLGDIDNLEPLMESPMKLELQVAELQCSMVACCSETESETLHTEFYSIKSMLLRELHDAILANKSPSEGRSAYMADARVIANLERLGAIVERIRQLHRASRRSWS